MSKKLLFSIPVFITTLALTGCGGGGADISHTEMIKSENNKKFEEKLGESINKNNALTPDEYQEEARRLKDNTLTITNSSNSDSLEATLIENNHTLMKYKNNELYLSFSTLPAGLSTKKIHFIGNDLQDTGNLYSYQLPFSLASIYRNYDKGTSIHYVLGSPTRLSETPSTGKAQYKGFASDGRESGELIYDIDFSTRKGSGIISGLSHYGEITLHEASLKQAPFGLNNDSIQSMTIADASVSSKKQDFDSGPLQNYGLILYGPKASELAGSINSFSIEHVIVFNGERGDIQE
ncbi:hypothetical protein KRX19_10135 [Cardiobacteriaceae bacterium TAE3-ERU3]|nr:hypothetical protein [Cardiobacteriaceae bacterium TAE3-ERU3]